MRKTMMLFMSAVLALCGVLDGQCGAERPIKAVSLSDAERNDSAAMNATEASSVDGEKGGVRIVFIGNSITLHNPLPSIGWTNMWGMAASAEDKDYVHLVTRGIERDVGRRADVRVKNLAFFERNYRTWDAASGVKELVDFDPEYLIVALGENGPNLATDEDREAYRAAFGNLVGAFFKDGRRPNTAIRGVFWPNAAKDAEMARVADWFGVPFVKADIAETPGMKATGLFRHNGVANHPSDAGMAEIASRVLDALCGRTRLPIACATHGFDVAVPVWTTAERDAINASVAFSTHFDWDGKAPLKLRLAGCSIFKVFVNGEFAAYGPARGPHGWFRMDEWDLSRVARNGDNWLSIVGVAYNTTTYYIVEHAPLLQAEVLADGKVVRATGDGKWDANFTERVRKTRRYSLQRAQSEVYEVPRQFSDSPAIVKVPPVKLIERGAPYPTFEIDRSYRPTDVLSVAMRAGDLGMAPHLWDEKSSILGRTYPDGELKHDPAVVWWKRSIEPKAKFEGGAAKIDADCGVRYEGAINNTGFLRLKVKVTKPGRLLVGFDEVLVGGKLDFLNRVGCNNIVMWDVKEPGAYDFESFEPYTFKFAEVIMLEGEATVESLEMRTYRNPNAARPCTLKDPDDRRIFEAARETFAQNAVDVFTDCPSRERAGWLCDSYFTGAVEHFFTGKNEIERTFLRNFALADRFPHLPEGMVPMCYPGDHINKNYIPNWSMWFILELASYFERTDDRETVDLLRPRVEGLLDFYARYRNADGALENLPAWVFVEWSHANDPKLVKDGVNWPSNMTYSDVLSKVARLYNRPELAEQSKKLKVLIRTRSYDGVWFRDNAKHPDVTETCQYYAFFHGIATPKTHSELWRKLTDEFGPGRQAKGLYREVWPSNAFIGNLMRLIVLKREGRDAQVSREIRGYYLKMADATGTLWEHDRPKASCNHGFASYLAILLDETNQSESSRNHAKRLFPGWRGESAAGGCGSAIARPL